MAATPGPPKNAPSYTQAQVISAITAAADKYGVPADVLIASANEESGLNPNEAGGGLFQDIVGGEAGNSVFGGNPENVYNLQLSVENAAQTFAASAKANPGADWGTIAAKAQRPLNPTAYATAINSAIGSPTNATLTADVTTTAPPAPASTDTALIPATTFAAPEKGVNVQNFHGYDLSAIPQNELGNAEQAITKYITDPGYAQQLQQRISQDYGYQGSWAEKVPQLNAVLIYAATSLDLSTAAGKNQFQSAVANTTWWKSTDANQRSWQQIQSTDPAQAHQALVEAQDKVLATANQIGVQLTKQQLSTIANQYASLNFVQSGSFGTSSGTAPEWLDQQVEQAVTAAGKTGTSDLFAQGPTTTTPGSLTGITSDLYQSFQQVAQQYLMYNKDGNGLLSDQQLMQSVNDALKSYTGTGASGQISQFESGALNAFTEQMKTQASQMYPTLAPSIAQGVTPSAYAAPLQSVVAKTLFGDSTATGSIDLTSPQWSWLIATPDPKTGVKSALTPDQVLQKITNPNFTFQDPSGTTMTYNNTNSAMQTAQAAVSGLGNFFGVGGA